ncbi:glycosyltransferase family 2 protein [Rhabdochromatium marinum]|uniref:glycosyltransferase family 2 protein n=1 Tax=Rhabdochromatium marinum TaxID=48729 RepID=UPI0019083B5D|nr:glycosyltransferase family 2 protein [Rhabdochromatium marinum]MBK1648595.1 glycosyltransferase [Rhabdochromatium marinum]
MQSDAPPDRSLSVVIPLYQEAENVMPMLERVHQGLSAYAHPWELILVDDGSRDATPAQLAQAAAEYGPHVRVIRFRRNFGQTAAMQAGFDVARGAFIATLDGDLQNDPVEIPRMLDDLIARDLDLLQGWRQRRQDALIIRKIPSRLANRLIGKVTGVRLHDYGCSLKVYRAEVIKEVRLYGEMHRFIPVWVASVTSPQRIGETVVSHQARQFGQSKYGISRTFRVLLDLLVAFFFLRFGGRPGHFFGSIGLGFGALGSLLMLHLLMIKFGFGEDIGQRPLLFIAILLLVASVQLLTTGVLAEMLVRTFFASSGRTHYGVLSKSDPAVSDWKER